MKELNPEIVRRIIEERNLNGQSTRSIEVRGDKLIVKSYYDSYDESYYDWSGHQIGGRYGEDDD